MRDRRGQARRLLVPAVLVPLLGLAAATPVVATPGSAGGGVDSRAAAPETARAEGAIVRLALKWRETAGGRRDLIATVTSSYTGRAEARIQARGEGQRWHAIKTMTLEAGRRTTRVPVAIDWFAPGAPLRVKLVGAGDRSTVWDEDTVPRIAPLSMDLQDPRGLRSAWLARWAPVHLEVPAAVEVTLAGGWPFSVERVRDPAGQPIPVTSPTPSLHRFQSTTAGRYVVEVGPEDQNGLYASTPQIIELPREQLVDVAPQLSGQRVVVRFEGVAGEAVTLTQREEAALLGPDGELVRVWLEHWTTGPIYRLPADGTYTLRYESANRVAVWSVPVRSLAVDGDPVDLAERASSDDAAVFVISNPGQLPWHVRGDCVDTPIAASVIVPPAGDPTLDWRIGRPQEGTYHLVFGGRGGIGGGPVRASSGRLIDLGIDGDPATLAADGPGCTWFRGSFHAQAGDVVSVWTEEGRTPTELELLGPHGVIPGAGLSETWIIPETGVYSWNTLEWEDWSATWRLRRWTQHEVPADGTPTVILLDGEPVWRARALRVDAVAGSMVTVTVEPPDRPGRWGAYVVDRSGTRLADALSAAEPSRTFVAPAGSAYVLWQDSLGPGPVTVTATTQP